MTIIVMIEDLIHVVQDLHQEDIIDLQGMIELLQDTREHYLDMKEHHQDMIEEMDLLLLHMMTDIGHHLHHHQHMIQQIELKHNILILMLSIFISSFFFIPVLL